MATFLSLLGITALLGAATYVTGRILVGVANVRWLRHTSLPNVVTAAFLGTMFWMLVAAASSHAGFPAPPTVGVLAGVMSILLAILLIQRRWNWLAPPTKPGVHLALVGLYGLGAVVGLFTVYKAQCFSTFNDSCFYISCAEFLQTNTVDAGSVVDPQQPLIYVRDHVQEPWFHNGAPYLFSLIQAMTPGYSAYEVYPAVIFWGLLLNICGIFVLCRWALRVPTVYSLAACVLTLVSINPLAFSYDSGFLSQIYGTAAITFVLAITARLLARANWRWGSAMVFAIAAAGLVSVYAVMAPFMAIGCLAYLVQACIRARKQHQERHFLLFFAQTMVALVIVGNLEFVRAYHNLTFMTGINGVGYPHVWSAWEFWAFALGWKPREYVMNSTILIVSVAATGCFLLGLTRIMAKTRQAMPIIFALGVFALLACYYHFFVKDPWSGEIGHTWNQFKLGKWSFPILVAVQIAGTYWLMKRLPLQKVLVTALCLLGVGLQLPDRITSLKILTHQEVARMGESPLQRFHELRQCVDELGAKNVYYIQDPIAGHPRWLLPSLFTPLPYLNSWQCEDSILHPGLDHDGLALTDEHTLFFIVGEPPFSEPLQKLPVGISRVDPRRPFVSYVNNLYGKETHAGQSYFWITDQSLKVRVWSPGEATVKMHLDLESGPSIQPSTRRSIRITPTAGPAQHFTLDEQQRFSLPVSLVQGNNTVIVECLDKPNHVLGPNDPRTLLAKLVNVELDLDYQPAQQGDGKTVETATTTDSDAKPR